MVSVFMHQVLVQAIRKYFGPRGNFLVASTEDLSLGDYYTNAAFVLSKEEGRPPREVAEALREKLLSSKPDFVEGVEVAGAGFINFRLKRDFFKEQVSRVIKAGGSFGSSDSNKGKKILLEYTSPNLFKPLHIGNLVGNILGESIARLLEKSGEQVVRLNYPSDIGLTVAKGVWGLKKTRGNPADINALGEAYRAGNTAYEDGSAKAEIESVNRALYENSDAELSSLRRDGVETSRRHLNTLCATLGTKFDQEFFESESGTLGRDIVRAHIGEVFEESEGAIIFKGSQTRVFLNSQGLPTYEAKEVGLFDLKSRTYPEFGVSLTVTGVEQKDFFAVVFESLRRVFPERTEGKILRHIANGFLRLPTGKMSSRKGNVITAEDLLSQVAEKVLAKMKEFPGTEEEKEKTAERVAVAALKYSILRQAPGKDIVFDPAQATSFEGDSGPYLLYSLVRVKTLLSKAKEAGESPNAQAEAPAETVSFERLLHRFPEVVERSARELAPQYVVTYLTELASAFNAFYAQTRIIGSPHAPYYLALSSAAGIVLENGLSVLGIPVVERM